MSVSSFFSTNSALVALANIGGVIGLFVIAYKIFRAAHTFIRNWYQTNLTVAIRRAEKRNTTLSINAAADIFLYASFLAIQSCYIFIAGLFLNMYNSYPISRLSKREFLERDKILDVSYYTYSQIMQIRTAIILAIMVLLFAYLLWNVFRVLVISRNVYRLRSKRINRAIRLSRMRGEEC